MSAADLVRDAIAINEARAVYLAEERRLRALAAEAREAGRPLTAGIHLYRAALCRRAALAELVDPDPAAGFTGTTSLTLPPIRNEVREP